MAVVLMFSYLKTPFSMGGKLKSIVWLLKKFEHSSVAEKWSKFSLEFGFMLFDSSIWRIIISQVRAFCHSYVTLSLSHDDCYTRRRFKETTTSKMRYKFLILRTRSTL